MTSMRVGLVWVVGALALSGCGDDDRGTLRDAGSRRDTGTPGEDGGMTGEDGGMTGEDGGMTGEDAGMTNEDAGPSCVDEDGDGYGEGADCTAPDCDDTNPDINEGATELCNTVDDDCDGMADDGFADLGMACAAGAGECASTGVYVCTGDGSGTECDAVPGTPGAETCNGLDDDCDAVIDNGFAGLGDACAAGVGACSRMGTQVCAAGGAAVECDAVPGTPGAETCNGLDDDCDGATDEMLGSSTCGVGTCVRTVANCVGGVPTMCAPGAPSPETCNGLDDDCDGSSDEGLGTISCGVGACARTAPACVGGMAGMCTPGMAAATDACPANGVDEDCNGTADEDCNDLRTSATTLTLAGAEVTVTGTTVGAAHDGPTVPCGCTSGANVWYTFTVPTAGVVYFDTAGSPFDTSLFITDAAGTAIPGQAGNQRPDLGVCNDDSGCGVYGDFTGNLQSRTWAYLTAGTYYLAVGGCGTGAFTLHAQYVANNVGSYFYAGRFSGDSSAATVLVGTSATSGTCGGTASGEDVRWITSCGRPQFLSLCMSDGGTYSRRIGTVNYDPTMYIRSARTGAQVACNDDGTSMGGTNCQGTGGDTANYGSRLNDIVVPRGLNTVFVDERSGGTGMTYTLRHIIRD